jgi:hypothetical protein
MLTSCRKQELTMFPKTHRNGLDEEIAIIKLARLLNDAPEDQLRGFEICRSGLSPQQIEALRRQRIRRGSQENTHGKRRA